MFYLQREAPIGIRALRISYFFLQIFRTDDIFEFYIIFFFAFQNLSILTVPRPHPFSKKWCDGCVHHVVLGYFRNFFDISLFIRLILFRVGGGEVRETTVVFRSSWGRRRSRDDERFDEKRAKTVIYRENF